MFKDTVVVWVLEYIFGGTLVLLPLAALSLWQVSWVDIRIWTAELFIVCLGVTLISCASSTRQRMLLAKGINRLAQQMRDHCISSQQ